MAFETTFIWCSFISGNIGIDNIRGWCEEAKGKSFWSGLACEHSLGLPYYAASAEHFYSRQLVGWKFVNHLGRYKSISEKLFTQWINKYAQHHKVLSKSNTQLRNDQNLKGRDVEDWEVPFIKNDIVLHHTCPDSIKMTSIGGYVYVSDS